MREAAQQAGDCDRMQLWAGQSAKVAQNQPAATIVHRLWKDASQLPS
jgi:nitronate monooxygenase